MSTEATSVVAQPSPAPDGTQPVLEDRKHGGEPSNRRVKQLLEQIFGHSLDAQIKGLLAVRKGERVEAPDEALRAAYGRGRADLLAEIKFAERLAEIRSRYPDFDSSWNRVRPLVPRVVWAEVADSEHGLEAAYRLAKLPELCRELSELDPEKARERFRHFVKDVVALGGLR